MQTITAIDQRTLSRFVRSLYGMNSVQLILERLTEGLPRLIGADSVFVASADPHKHRVALLAENVGSDLHKLWPTLVELRHENPAISHHMAQPDGPALMIRDLLPMSAWQRTAVFNEFYVKLGMRERLSLSLSFARPDITGVVAHRRRGAFSEANRAMLNLLRCHVMQTCANVKTPSPPACPSLMEALGSLVGGGIVALDAAGKLQFCSDLARQTLEGFFAKERPFQDGLPPTVKTWVRTELSRFETDELAVRPLQPLVARVGERTLRIRIAQTREGDGCVLLMRTEDPVVELARLSDFGLGARSTEVLYWLAKGKTNKEIAIILGMAAETVKTHLKEIYLRLHLENRATAAAMISPLLTGA
jgi:DNA-binding CsgD family transcriptional regulator